MSIVEEYKADGTINIAQTLAGMPSVSSLQTVENLMRDKQVIDRVVSFGVACNSLDEAVVLRMIID